MRIFHFLPVCFIVIFMVGCAQLKVVDFLSATTSDPIDKRITITNVIYQNGKFNSIQNQQIKSSRAKPHSINDKMRLLVDESQIIDYKLDTIYLLSTTYVPTSSVSMTIKTTKGTFVIAQNTKGDYTIYPLKDFYANLSEDERLSDFLLYEAIFSWDIDELTQLIKSSGGLLGSEYSMTATRIILKDNQIFKKDIINFEPALRWIK